MHCQNKEQRKLEDHCRQLYLGKGHIVLEEPESKICPPLPPPKQPTHRLSHPAWKKLLSGVVQNTHDKFLCESQNTSNALTAGCTMYFVVCLTFRAVVFLFQRYSCSTRGPIPAVPRTRSLERECSKSPAYILCMRNQFTVLLTLFVRSCFIICLPHSPSLKERVMLMMKNITWCSKSWKKSIRELSDQLGSTLKLSWRRSVFRLDMPVTRAVGKGAWSLLELSKEREPGVIVTSSSSNVSTGQGRHGH